MQAADGGSVYLRLSTRALEQPEREISPTLEADIVAGGYWMRSPAPGAELAIVCCGAVTPEAMRAHDLIAEDLPGAGLLVVTSPDRLYSGWQQSRRGGEVSHAERLLRVLPAEAALVTVIDGHPATLAWLGAVAGQRVRPLGVDHFGQSGDIPDLYRTYALDEEAILDAAAKGLLERIAAR
jgi:pyruvate dehydrogenase E1 component